MSVSRGINGKPNANQRKVIYGVEVLKTHTFLTVQTIAQNQVCDNCKFKATLNSVTPEVLNSLLKIGRTTIDKLNAAWRGARRNAEVVKLFELKADVSKMHAYRPLSDTCDEIASVEIWSYHRKNQIKTIWKPKVYKLDEVLQIANEIQKLRSEHPGENPYQLCDEDVKKDLIIEMLQDSHALAIRTWNIELDNEKAQRAHSDKRKNQEIQDLKFQVDKDREEVQDYADKMGKLELQSEIKKSLIERLDADKTRIIGKFHACKSDNEILATRVIQSEKEKKQVEKELDKNIKNREYDSTKARKTVTENRVTNSMLLLKRREAWNREKEELQKTVDTLKKDQEKQSEVEASLREEIEKMKEAFHTQEQALAKKNAEIEQFSQQASEMNRIKSERDQLDSNVRFLQMVFGNFQQTLQPLANIANSIGHMDLALVNNPPVAPKNVPLVPGNASMFPNFAPTFSNNLAPTSTNNMTSMFSNVLPSLPNNLAPTSPNNMPPVVPEMQDEGVNNNQNDERMEVDDQ